ncbi:outer membrane protein assembly factor BamC [Pantoea sp. SoEX]|uniref:outer membrane protein assembly factor BamC n=1 Tax=Pantoea sp. SoEX TaxID=2576763 RepID=UPI001359F0A5|nr:outer membrane protein assembly factor BamC [Pantoea sp. SoEX]MXP50845.1 outer membrane protein assembly factor BamC [Pantoea sp. SoEX]
MNYLVKNSICTSIIKILVVTFLLTSCSYNQFNINESYYLKANKLQQLKSPNNMIFPIQKGDYDIPIINNNKIKKKSNLYPPIQLLEIIDNTDISFDGNKGLLLINQHNIHDFWTRIIHIIKVYNFPILSSNKIVHTLTTNWILLPQSYGRKKYIGKYNLSLQTYKSKLLFIVNLINLKQGEKSVTSPFYMRHYTIQMLNKIILGLDKTKNNNTLLSYNNKINIQSIIDNENELPMLKLNTSFNIAWQRLEAAMNVIGMRVIHSNKIQGNFNITYKKPNNLFWKSINTGKPSLPDGNYTVQLGDFNNYVSLRFINAKGNIVNKKINDSLMKVLQNVINKQN